MRFVRLNLCRRASTGYSLDFAYFQNNSKVTVVFAITKADMVVASGGTQI